MDILDELYYGNVNPFERHTDRNPECRDLQGFITRHMETLKEKLDGDGQETLEKLEVCLSEFEGMCEKDAFTDGFCLGARIMLQVMNYETEKGERT